MVIITLSSFYLSEDDKCFASHGYGHVNKDLRGVSKSIKDREILPKGRASGLDRQDIIPAGVRLNK